jgi:mannosyltransferase OCH1-like enzyme
MIPKIIWQTYESKYDELVLKAVECSDSWKEKNPEWEYKYFSSSDRERFVLDNFGKEWLEIYNSYKINVLRSTLWRYMCLYIHGGLYADLDILCKMPIESWLNLDLDFAVSKEPNNPGYTQMIFASCPKSIFLKNLLEDIKDIYYANKKSNKVYANIIDYSIYQTGYITFTRSISKTIESYHLDNFMIYTGNDAKKIHFDAIYHHRAGTKNKVFGPDYVAWQTEELESN